MSKDDDTIGSIDPYAHEAWQLKSKVEYRNIIREHGPRLHRTLIGAGRLYLHGQGVDLSTDGHRTVADSAIAYAMLVSARRLLMGTVDADNFMRRAVDDVIGKFARLPDDRCMAADPKDSKR